MPPGHSFDGYPRTNRYSLLHANPPYMSICERMGRPCSTQLRPGVQKSAIIPGWLGNELGVHTKNSYIGSYIQPLPRIGNLPVSICVGSGKGSRGIRCRILNVGGVYVLKGVSRLQNRGMRVCHESAAAPQLVIRNGGLKFRG